MPREVKEWVGRTDSTAPPPRVKDRILKAQDDRCAKCQGRFGSRATNFSGPEFDHIVALINSGENRESNLRALCHWCHTEKTKADVAEKSKIARVRKKHLGIVTKRHGFQKPDPTKFERIGFGRYERIKT